MGRKVPGQETNRWEDSNVTNGARSMFGSGKESVRRYPRKINVRKWKGVRKALSAQDFNAAL